MKLLAELSDEDILEPMQFPAEYHVRRSARVIMMKGNHMALMRVARDNFHTLPGGGVKAGESLREAARREVLEETGCIMQLREEVGHTVEHRAYKGQLQYAYCYLADFIETVREPELTEKEKNAEFQVVWVPLADALAVLKTDTPTTKTGKFIVLRECFFIKEAQRIVSKRK